MLFNGTNTDPASKQIYQAWLKRHAGQESVSGSPTADMRSALVEQHYGTILTPADRRKRQYRYFWSYKSLKRLDYLYSSIYSEDR